VPLPLPLPVHRTHPCAAGCVSECTRRTLGSRTVTVNGPTGGRMRPTVGSLTRPATVRCHWDPSAHSHRFTHGLWHGRTQAFAVVYVRRGATRGAAERGKRRSGGAGACAAVNSLSVEGHCMPLRPTRHANRGSERARTARLPSNGAMAPAGSRAPLPAQSCRSTPGPVLHA
jgi:hypothetical protein